MIKIRSSKSRDIISGPTYRRVKSPFVFLRLPKNIEKPKYALYSQVALRQDFPEHKLKCGSVATVVERYELNGKYGYSLDGFELPNITLEVAEEQITSLKTAKRSRSQSLAPQ